MRLFICSINVIVLKIELFIDFFGNTLHLCTMYYKGLLKGIIFIITQALSKWLQFIFP